MESNKVNEYSTKREIKLSTKMKTSIRLGLVIGLILFIASTALATCSVSVSGLNVEVRADNDTQYSSAISAEKSTEIDIKIDFDIDSYSGNDCPANISARPKIYKYNENTSTWEVLKTATTKSQELSQDNYTFTWSNEFETGSNEKYVRFKVEGSVLKNSEVIDTQEAFVDVVNNSCSGINLITSKVTIDEGKTTSRTFRIENNTNNGFSISNLNLSFTNALIRSGTTDYDNFVSAHSSRTITMNLDTAYVSSNTTTTGRLEASGNLGSISCSAYDIGVENFDITVQNTSNSDGYYDDYHDNYDYYGTGYYGTSSDCDALELQANDFSINEGIEQKLIFGLKNNSSKRFEILEIQSTNSGVLLSNFSNDKYVFSGQVGTIILNAQAPSVLRNTNYSNTIKVRGKFIDGRSCALNDLSTTFTVIVLDASSGASINCSAFEINAPANSIINDYGAVPITINNMTNKRVDIYVEGSVDATPTIISLPSNTSINRGLSITMPQKSGYLTLRAVVEGCSIPITTVNLTNNSTQTTTEGQTQNTASQDNGGATGLFSLGANTGTIGVILLIVIIAIILVGIITGYDNARRKGEDEQAWVKK